MTAVEGDSNPPLVTRYASSKDKGPYDTVEWGLFTAELKNMAGETVFIQENVEAPASWSQTAVNIVASKYFRGHLGTPERETSVRQLIGRVVNTIVKWGFDDGYYTPEEAEVFHDELVTILLDQRVAFNSPVWFNVGALENPPCSACFLVSVDDSMESIMQLARNEAIIFKGGSGSGSNVSPIRSSKEKLSGGGFASGPVSFMKGLDAFAGVIKSGGRTRRAAKLLCMNTDHPDIREFIECKVKEEKKAWALIDAGYGSEIDGDAYGSVFFQNANHSIRATDDFMRAVVEDKEWDLVEVSTGYTAETVRAKDLLMEAATAAWECGDPGIQYHTTINDWYPSHRPVVSSNPCSEVHIHDDNSCNLASLNLMTFYDSAKGEFDADMFMHCVRLIILAQDILVTHSKYPTEDITKNSHDYRPLGLGYANVGALLMVSGFPYDSDDGRALIASITSLMTSTAYKMSYDVAQRVGPYAGFEADQSEMKRVIRKHGKKSEELVENSVGIAQDLALLADFIWDVLVDLATEGFRNNQVTSIAPTGTISFMMDCATTGIEPDIALVKYKNMVGGGRIRMVNPLVTEALEALNYSPDTIKDIISYIDDEDTIEGSVIHDEDLAVFDCAFKPAKGLRFISPRGHMRMVAAAQPFLSQGVSKTINMPNSATVQDIYDMYVEAWQEGVKCIAVYRDGCKRVQALSTSKHEGTEKNPTATTIVGPMRKKLRAERPAITHKFTVGGHEGYITVGMFDDGTPGEMFITMSKGGSTMSGLMDTIATQTSIALQYGVPLEVLVDKFSHVRFEPAGFTGNPELPVAKSLVDYVFRWVGQRFSRPLEIEPIKARQPATDTKSVRTSVADSPPCSYCGSITVRSGTCYTCTACGASNGGCS